MPIIYDEPMESRFWNKVSKGDGCWEWTGCLFKTGYGKMRGNNNKTVYAHRVSYEINKGPIPAGLLIRHSCDNRKCVRPDHLLAGTHMDNSHDAIERGRTRPGRSYGVNHGRCRHPFLTVKRVRALVSSGAPIAVAAQLVGVRKSTAVKWCAGKDRVLA